MCFKDFNDGLKQHQRHHRDVTLGNIRPLSNIHIYFTVWFNLWTLLSLVELLLLWCNATNVLIEKDPWRPQIHHLRIIYLKPTLILPQAAMGTLSVSQSVVVGHPSSRSARDRFHTISDWSCYSLTRCIQPLPCPQTRFGKIWQWRISVLW